MYDILLNINNTPLLTL